MTSTTMTPRPVLERPENGDHERFAHYVFRSSWADGYIHGKEVMALCGKRWVPTQNPDEYPLCPTCVERAEQLQLGL